jgi:hypothetical protein
MSLKPKSSINEDSMVLPVAVAVAVAVAVLTARGKNIEGWRGSMNARPIIVTNGIGATKITR